MNNQNAVIEKASAFLGKNLNNYQTNYNPNLLVPIERKFNREDYKITKECLTHHGNMLRRMRYFIGGD